VIPKGIAPFFVLRGERITVEGWAGNGGQMAGARRKQAVLGKANAGERFKKAKKLNKEALKLVDEKAAEIAKSLYDSTLDGHVLSARLLVELAEGNVDAEEAMTLRPLRSLASDLAAEPQWPREELEAVEETGAGSREPQGA
jgi:hypothetical protein